MGLDVHLKREDWFEVRLIPKIAYSSHSSGIKEEERFECYTNVEDRVRKDEHSSTYYLLDGDTNKLCLSSHSSTHWKSMSLGFFAVDLKDNVVLKRGSMYRSSREVKRIQRLQYGRSKMGIDVNDDAFLSFDFDASLPLSSSRGTVLYQELKYIPLSVEQECLSFDYMKSISKKNVEFLDLSFHDLPEERSKISISCCDAAEESSSSADSFLRICMQTRELSSPVVVTTPDLVAEVQIGEKNCNAHLLVSSGVDATKIYERNEICALSKSFSAKVGNSYLSFQSLGENMKSSSKNRFSPLKKMLNPIMKSKSQHSVSPVGPETSSITIPDVTSLVEVKSSSKSVPSGLSKESKKIYVNCKSSGKKQVLQTATSPAHLQAILKRDLNSGAPFYEFSVKDPEDVLCAKTWKTDNDFNCVYTFHCCRKNGSNTLVAKDRHAKQSTMIGQMQVSCCLYSSVTEAESSDDYLLAEFTLFDIALARSLAIERCASPSCSNQNTFCPVTESLVADSPLKPSRLIETERHQLPIRCRSSDSGAGPSMFYPWSLSDLHSNLEIAAIIIQIPFNKKEALKDMQGAANVKSKSLGLSTACATDHARVPSFNNLSASDVMVVTPSGAHGLPNGEEARASSLLDRWRLGGGCDCGGWDMGCPIAVFDTACNSNVDSTIGSLKAISFFAKGKKEKLPALSITANGKGQYAIDFHAQLSALQAFSICVAVLHGSEVSLAICREKQQHKIFPDSLKLLLEEDGRHTTEAGETEKRNVKKIELLVPSFFLDPPFSPVARV